MVNENIALVQDFVSAFNRFDLDAVEDMMAPDIFYHNIPFAPCIGRRAFRDFMTGFPAVSASWVIHAIAANGDTVLTERTDKFFMADKSTISVRVMGAFEIENGKISKWRDYFDPAESANVEPASV
jgi:limonene-1,2-epoxide hydrolase